MNLRMLLLFTGLLLQNIHSATAQPILTRGEVYDFQPGDIFRIHTYSICGCISDEYEYNVVEQRTQSANGDTVFYVIRRTFGLPNAPAMFWDTLTEYYTGLQKPFLLPNDSIIFSQNFYTDSCGQQRWEQLSIHPPDSIIVYDTMRSYVVQGCGGPYSHWDNLNTSMGCFVHTDLIYYKKGTVECGEIPPTGIANEPETSTFSIYPNPSSGAVYWNTEITFTDFELWSVDGRLVQQGKTNGSSLQTSNCPPGSYVLILVDSEGNRYRKSLIITAE